MEEIERLLNGLENKKLPSACRKILYWHFKENCGFKHSAIDECIAALETEPKETWFFAEWEYYQSKLILAKCSCGTAFEKEIKIDKKLAFAITGVANATTAVLRYDNEMFGRAFLTALAIEKSTDATGVKKAIDKLKGEILC